MVVLGVKIFAMFPTWIVTVCHGSTIENVAVSIYRFVSTRKKIRYHKIHIFTFFAGVMKFDYVFAENGLVAFKKGEEIGKEVS